MFRATSGVAASVALLLGCGTPGYSVRVEAKGIVPGEQHVLSNLENKAKASSGFVTVFERKESKSFPGTLTSSYVKYLSDAWRDHIFISIHYLTPEERIVLDIHCLLRGMEPPVKSEIDALGDMFIEELSREVGMERVLVKRERASIPLVY